CQVVQRLPGVEDVVEDDDVATADVGQEARLDVELARPRNGAAVTGRLDEAEAQVQVEVADQVGQEHQGAGEHADDGDRAVAVVRRDLPGQFGDALLDPLGGDEDVHGGAPWLRAGRKIVLNTKDPAKERRP